MAKIQTLTRGPYSSPLTVGKDGIFHAKIQGSDPVYGPVAEDVISRWHAKVKALIESSSVRRRVNPPLP